MAQRISRTLLSVVLTLAVLTGAYLGWQRHTVETVNNTVELAVDYNDIKALASFAHYPVDRLLDEIRSRGVTSIGVLEETLPEASALGELYFISKGKTFVLSDNSAVRRRVLKAFGTFLPQDQVKLIGRKKIEINEGEITLRGAGIGISEAAQKQLTAKGFNIIPRLWNNPRCNAAKKIEMFSGYNIIIFDGEEILGYPDQVPRLARAMKRNNIRFGCVEIIKQLGSDALRKKMDTNIIRVHSIARDELVKVNRDEAVARFARAARERSIRLMYVRPYLPPQLKEEPVAYNLEYLSNIKKAIEAEGFSVGSAIPPRDISPRGWQVLLLGLGVVIGTLLLFSAFIALPVWVTWVILFVSVIAMVFVGAGGAGAGLEKALALLAAIVFPSYAVISQFSKQAVNTGRIYIDAIYLLLNVVMDTLLGVFLIVGLLANTSFLVGSQVFPAIKIALAAPLLIVAFYFFFKTESGFDIRTFKERLLNILGLNVPVWLIASGMVALGILGILLARSGNFVIPVPGFEKAARTLLETLLSVRPRTKEFLIGYPFLIAAAALYLKNRREWLPLLLTIGVIGPVSMLNSFCHIHSPLSVSIIRSLNGLVLGVAIGCGAIWAIKKSNNL